MRYPCSYCGVNIRPSDDIECNGDANALSHGNCSRCHASLMTALDDGQDITAEALRESARDMGPACQRGIWG